MHLIVGKHNLVLVLATGEQIGWSAVRKERRTVAAAVDKVNVFETIGKSPAELAEEMEAFSESAEVFSSNRPRLISKYENKWIGVYDGEIVEEDSLLALTEKIKERGIPLNQTMIRRIERERKTFIL
jgi:hypothetical protein